MKGFSKRLDHVQEYYFSQKLKEVAKLKAEGKNVINMGIGSPDLPPHRSVIEALNNTASSKHAHGYQGYQGIPALREAIGQFYQDHYQVRLNTDSEILPLMGSKEGIVHVSMAFLDEGDEVLIPNPGYPTYAAACKLAGAHAIAYDLKEENNWEPDFEALKALDLTKVKIMWVNYPHMPTGSRGSKELFQKIIQFGLENDVLIINDNPYSFILENEPKSILSISGAHEIALELNSLSKTANMAGWRVGWLAGRADMIDAVLKVKSNMDSGMFLGIQRGAIAALSFGKGWYTGLNEEYQRRKMLILELASLLDLEVSKGAVGMFVWAKIKNNQSEIELVDKLLNKKNIFITPGSIFGSNGAGYVRFSLCVPEVQIREAIERIKSI
ncbi:pyridoxal phosphate-dependent aminotransferase [Belliella pelovolcani]|uniref:pyridoxal phosphate-dependent aminotransferase n=1 Tax=Belliella pelovolcani TaxID=529505 RepID=UPI0039189505